MVDISKLIGCYKVYESNGENVNEREKDMYKIGIFDRHLIYNYIDEEDNST